MDNNQEEKTTIPKVTDYIESKKKEPNIKPPETTRGEFLPNNKIIVRRRRLYNNNNEEIK